MLKYSVLLYFVVLCCVVLCRVVLFGGSVCSIPFFLQYDGVSLFLVYVHICLFTHQPYSIINYNTISFVPSLSVFFSLFTFCSFLFNSRPCTITIIIIVIGLILRSSYSNHHHTGIEIICSIPFLSFLSVVPYPFLSSTILSSVLHCHEADV